MDNDWTVEVKDELGSEGRVAERATSSEVRDELITKENDGQNELNGGQGRTDEQNCAVEGRTNRAVESRTNGG